MSREKVFVYGTLLKDLSNHSLISRDSTHKFCGEHTTGAEYTMISCGGFPAVLQGGNTGIVGEVYEVDENTLYGPLDGLEGYPRFYDRKYIHTPYGDAWMYYLPEEAKRHYPTVSSGNWKTYKETGI